jgi:hypothetical protein
MVVGFELWSREESSTKAKKSLTSEVNIGNLEKFAKTSLAAEVILDGPKYSR